MDVELTQSIYITLVAAILGGMVMLANGGTPILVVSIFGVLVASYVVLHYKWGQ